MTRPIIATKLYVPKLRRGLVARPRLHAKIAGVADARLVLVSAPAGFGKTTFLVEWLEEMSSDGIGVAWIALDPSDSDPLMFWSCVVEALDSIVPLGPSARGLLDASTLSTDLMITTLVNELVLSTDDVWLVLDDFHTVDNRDVVHGVSVLLDRLPAHVHMVISTRVDPDLPLSRLRVRGELVEIRATDLRFTADEVAAYLNDVSQLGLADGDVAVLEQRTEGWVAALQLAALSIRGHDDVDGFIARFAGNDRYLVDYLVEEVLQRQPTDVRDFLSQSSVLNRLSGPLCDAVTGGRDGREMLEALERANLFVVPLDDQREWFRYHHLFADALRARSLADQPERVTLNHTRASEWYDGHDFTEDAVRHANAAGDFDRTTRLIERALPEVRRDRDDTLLLGWLRALPTQAVRKSPVLSVFFGWSLMTAGDFDDVEPWFEHAEHLLTAAPTLEQGQWVDTVELRSLPATVSVFRAALAHARGEASAASGHARQALALAERDDHQARAGAAGFLGLTAWADGDVATALATFSGAIDSIRSAGNLADELTSTVILTDMWLAAGRASEARRLLHAALERARASGPATRGVADIHVALSEIALSAGNLDAAKTHLENATTVDARLPMGDNRFRLSLARAKVAEAEGDVQEVIDELDRAEELYRPGFVPQLRPIPAIRARMSIAQGDLDAANSWAKRSGITDTDEVHHHREFELLTLARLLIARHREQLDGNAGDDAQGALLLLERLRDAASKSGRLRTVVETQLLTALALDAQGHHMRAVESLQQAFSDGTELEAHVRLVLDEGTPMFALLGRAVDSADGSAPAQRLLDHAASERKVQTAATPQKERPTRTGTLVDPLSDRELHVLRLLATDLSGPEIAGHLFVSLNTFRTHTKRIFTKLDVTSRRSAVSRARELGLM